MKIDIDNVIRDMTDEEYRQYMDEQREREEEESSRPPTQMELIQAQIIYTALLTDTMIEDE